MDHNLGGQDRARVRWNTQASGAAFDRKKQSFLNAEAQEFLAQRVMCVIAGRDRQGMVSGQLVFGLPGFARSTQPSICLLELDDKSMQSDLITHLQQRSLAGNNDQIALFFINYAARQRLCIHGRAEVVSTRFFVPRPILRFQRPRRLRISVKQAFFHCPKYIHTTIAGLTTPAVMKFEREQLLRAFQDGTRRALSAPLGDFLEHQISCFLCTISQQGVCAINHRGGAPGFLTVLPPEKDALGGRLLLPDYKGNGAFEAIGNIFETGLATLVVPDYSMHVALAVSGIASLLEPDELSPDLQARCKGAERVISLNVEHVVLQSGDWTLPLAHEQVAYEQAAACVSENQNGVPVIIQG